MSTADPRICLMSVRAVEGHSKVYPRASCSNQLNFRASNAHFVFFIALWASLPSDFHVVLESMVVVVRQLQRSALDRCRKLHCFADLLWRGEHTSVCLAAKVLVALDCAVVVAHRIVEFNPEALFASLVVLADESHRSRVMAKVRDVI